MDLRNASFLIIASGHQGKERYEQAKVWTIGQLYLLIISSQSKFLSWALNFFSVLTEWAWLCIMHCIMQSAMMILYIEWNAFLTALCFCKHWNSLQWWPVISQLLKSIKTPFSHYWLYRHPRMHQQRCHARCWSLLAVPFTTIHVNLTWKGARVSYMSWIRQPDCSQVISAVFHIS